MKKRASSKKQSLVESLNSKIGTIKRSAFFTLPKIFKGKLKLSILLRIIKQACDAITPVIKEIYSDFQKELSNGVTIAQSKLVKIKPDKSPVTLADGIVQGLLVDYLLEGKFDAYMCEENSKRIFLETAPFQVLGIAIDEKYTPGIQEAKKKLIKLREKLTEDSYGVLYIDPIDATKSYIRGNGQQCTILVGIVQNNQAVAGLVYRPLTSTPIFAMGCKSEKFYQQNFNQMTAEDRAGYVFKAPQTDQPRLLTPIQGASKFLEKLKENLDMEPLGSAGIGNKVLLLLDGTASLVVLDAGTSKWDTCGPQAVIEAAGGDLVKLTSLMKRSEADVRYAKRICDQIKTKREKAMEKVKDLPKGKKKNSESDNEDIHADTEFGWRYNDLKTVADGTWKPRFEHYHYADSYNAEFNLDLETCMGTENNPLRPLFTDFNCVATVSVGQRVSDENFEHLKVTSNINGIFAYSPHCKDELLKYIEAVNTTLDVQAPSFD